MATPLETLQAQLPAAQKKYSDLQTKYNGEVSQREDWRAKALACGAARDQFTLDSRKNQACNIVSLTLFNKNWGDWEQKAKKSLVELTSAKNALDGLNTQIDVLIKQGAAALNNDPQFNLAQQQLTNTAQLEAAKLAEDQKTKRTITIVAVILGGIATIAGIFKLISVFGNKSNG